MSTTVYPTSASGGAPTGTVAALDADTDTTLAANSDSRVATQKATKAYADLLVTGLLDFKGSTNCSANPNYPAASKGDAYVVSNAGKIGGGSGRAVDVGDVYLATADNAGGTQGAVGSSWAILEHNLEGALLTANNLSDVANAATALTNLGGQPLDADLTAIAALTTTAYGRALLEIANQAALTALLAIGNASTAGILKLGAAGGAQAYSTALDGVVSGSYGNSSGTFGTGEDGAADFNGSNTFAFASKSGNTYTLTRNVQLSSCTVRAGCSLVLDFGLFVNGALTIEATGAVYYDGAAGSGVTGGAAPAHGWPLSTRGAGGNGRTTTAAGVVGGGSGTQSHGAQGGAGGASGLGQAGGGGGSYTAWNLTDGPPLSVVPVGVMMRWFGSTPADAQISSGGGGGGANVGSGTATSGGGGAGGALVVVCAKTISNAGVIRAHGGNGANGAVTGNGQAGGGGGGGGGYLVVTSNTPQASAGTITVAGGTGGTGAGGGSNGVDGGAGKLVYRGP